MIICESCLDIGCSARGIVTHCKQYKPVRILEQGPTGRKPEDPGAKLDALSIQVDGNHYKNMPIQPILFCQKNQLNFCESNVVKYVCRHRNKNGAIDIKKAIHNLQLILEMEYKEII